MDGKNEKLVKKEENSVEFVPLGVSDKIRLTASMVRQFIAVPTKSGALPSERDCIRFIMLCRGKRANPFEGDCFLIGYDSQSGPTFSLVCGLELFLKRACAEESYDGSESGVIVLDKEGKLTEREGTLLLEDEKLAGGWAKVYRKDRKLPVHKTVKFSTYDTGRSRWQKDPAGMIAKVAQSQGLREAFPLALGGLYTQEEMSRVAETGDGIVSPKKPVPRLFEHEQVPEDVPVEHKQPSAPADNKPPVAESGEPSTLDKIYLFWTEQNLSEGKLIALLRKDGILDNFGGLDKLTPKQAEQVLEKIGVYASRAMKG